jgi:hypothetical protein
VRGGAEQIVGEDPIDPRDISDMKEDCAVIPEIKPTVSGGEDETISRPIQYTGFHR